MDKVSGALLKQLAAGDKPKSISSPNLDMSVGRKTLDSIGGVEDDDDAEEGEGMGGVKLPNPMALFGGANASVEEGATSAIGSTVSRNIFDIIIINFIINLLGISPRMVLCVLKCLAVYIVLLFEILLSVIEVCTIR